MGIKGGSWPASLPRRPFTLDYTWVLPVAAWLSEEVWDVENEDSRAKLSEFMRLLVTAVSFEVVG